MERAGDFSGSPHIGNNRRSVDRKLFETPVSKDTVMIPSVTLSEESINKKTSEDLWYIYGKYYDLTEFINSHPGGVAILKMSKGLVDCTPLVESYHAFGNREYISKLMSKYEINYVPEDAATRVKMETHYTFEENGFYRTLLKEVRAHFGAKSDNESITKRVKANSWWTIKVFTLFFIFAITYILAFLVPLRQDGYMIEKVILAAISGSVFFMVGFNAMHDASHYAVGNRDSWKNKLTMRIWNSLSLWDSAKWLFHHTVKHHSFTGDSKHDPDVIHASPFIKKALEENPDDYFSYTTKIGGKFSIKMQSYIQTGIYATVLHIAQVLVYQIWWPMVGMLWLMPIEKTRNAFDKYWWEYAISFFMIATHFYQMNLFVSLAFFLGQSISYGLCILADHDTFESAIENHVHGGDIDWGEVQVRHSSDFAAKGIYGRIFSEVFGAINAQIAHHLFPSVNHVFLPELIPIIRKVCIDFNIPYSSHDTLLGALHSVSRTIEANHWDAIEKNKAAVKME